MPTQQDVNTNILTAQLKVADMVLASLSARASGFTYNYNPIREARRTINAVLHQYILGDYISTGFLNAYDCLLQFIGTYGAGGLNPNAGGPNFTVIIEETGFTPTPPYIKNQNDLVEDGVGSGNWYLPFLDNSGNIPPAGIIPVQVTDTLFEGSFTFTVNDSFTPWRIYPFTSNDPQEIIVYLNL